MYQALSTTLGNHFSSSKATINLMTKFIIALITVRDVNLTAIATATCGNSQIDSCYRTLQRFFVKFEICYVALAKLLIAIAKISDSKWILILDRTNWKFGNKYINILVLSVSYHNIGIPILWTLLDNNGGNSNTKDRQELIKRFISIFKVDRINCLLADREFVGDIWLKFLASHGIKFYIRIRSDITIGRARKELLTANGSIRGLKPNESITLKGERYLGMNYKGPKVKVAACRNDKGELMIVATNDNEERAIEMYRERWSIENLFGCLKTRGFNFENTHMVDLAKISKLLGLLAITFTFCHVLGIWRNEIKPIKTKSHKRKAQSLFRYGLDYFRKILLQVELFANELQEIVDKFLSTVEHLIKSLIIC